MSTMHFLQIVLKCFTIHNHLPIASYHDKGQRSTCNSCGLLLEAGARMSNGGDFGGENGFCVECACLMWKVQGSSPGGSTK